MHKFEIGQIVIGEDCRMYIVEDTGVDKDGNNIYLLKEAAPRYVYRYESTLEACHGTVGTKTE